MDLNEIISNKYPKNHYENSSNTKNIITTSSSQNYADILSKRVLRNYLSLEIEKEKSNGNRDVYINRELIFSDKYVNAIKSLSENRYCSKRILDSSRKILEHHHGDKYEDLYFIDSETNQVLSRTDYRVREQEVLPTTAMKNMARNNPNIISIHNHPTDALPSPEDIKTCYLVGYKYGLVVCHNGNIFQYRTIDDVNINSYDMECHIYYKNEQKIADELKCEKITKTEFDLKHYKNFITLSSHSLDFGIMIKEVIWNGKPKG